VNALTLTLALFAGAENPYLAEAKALASGLEFERCVERLKQAQTQWRSTPGELGEIEVWSGLCHFSLGHRRQAVEHFRTALRIDESTDLPPYSSPKAVELFLKVKLSLRQPAEPMPDVDLPADAPARVELTPRLTQAPAVEQAPAVPFPWKQRAAPIALSAVALVAAGTALGLGVNARALEQRANTARTEADFAALGQAAQGSATASVVGWAVAAAALTGAVVTFFVVPAADEPAPE
jgi:hypothetical protein